MQKRNNLRLIILFIVIAIGLLLRLHAYFVNSSFFVDEELLSFNVIFRSYKGLLDPLGFFQAAPVLFLFLTKFVISKLGISEPAFRLIPFVSSVLSIIPFYLLTKKFIERYWIRILCLFLFCTNFQLLLYTQTFKPYSSDVLVTILVLLTALSVDLKNIKWYYALLLGILSSIAFSFSFPSIFTISAIVLVNLFYSKEFKKIAIFLLPNLITVSWYFITNLHVVKNSAVLNDFWVNGFNIFSANLYKTDYNFLFTYFSYPQIFAFLMLAGIIMAYRNEKFKTLILVSPVFITLLAAAFKIYPFEKRLILFLLPIFLIILVYPLDKIKFEKKPLQIIALTFSLVFFINYFIIFTTNFVAHKICYVRVDAKPLLVRIQKEKHTNDILYLYYGAKNAYLYYSLCMPLPMANIFNGAQLENNKSPQSMIRQDLSKLPKYKTVLLLFVRENSNYDNDVKIYSDWLYKNAIVKKDIVLKSARLIEVCL